MSSLKVRIILFSITLLCACGSGDHKNLLEESLEADKNQSSSEDSSRQMLQDLIGSFSSPVEMAMFIKEINSEFNASHLLETDSLGSFTTSYEKALAMGGYSANLGYINVYERSFDAIEYIGALRKLSKDLDLEQFFEFKTLLSLAKKAENIDSLILLSTKSFNDIDLHLRENGRAELSLLMVIGTWLEGIHIPAEFYLEIPSDKLKNRLAEQKNSVEKLYKIVSKLYPDDSYFNKLKEELETLNNLYTGITVEFIYREPEMKEVNGELLFIDNSEIKIEASDKEIQDISREILRLRKLLLM